MRIIAVGDIHGRTIWQEIAQKERFDNFIFIGDYFDTLDDVSPDQQKENFKEIIKFKEANKEKVVLLFGNHDFHYLRGINEQYVGFQHWQKTDIGELLQNALSKDLMQMCFQYDKYLFSHAGVTKTWCENNDIDLSNVEKSINELFEFKPKKFKFTSGKNHDMYGNDVCQTPIWVRPQSLLIDGLEPYCHVVGHTYQKNICCDQWANPKMILIDTLGESGEYLVIENGEIEVKK